MNCRYLMPLTVLLVLAAAFMTVDDSDASPGDYEAGDFTVTLGIIDRTAQITGYRGTDTEVTIPATVIVDDVAYDVVGLSTFAFKGNTKVTKIVSETAMAAVPAQCFMGCTSLAEVDLGDRVTSIGDNAFAGCTSLEFEIPASVEYIYSGAFYGCSSLTSADIPSKTSLIGKEAFYDCTSLATLMMHEGLTVINDGAFANCTTLVSVSIPASVTVIGDGVFAGCHSLESIDADSPSYRSADGVLFKVTGGISGTLVTYPAGKDGASYVVPSDVKMVCPYAFSLPEGAGLKEVIIQSGTSVPADAFHDARSVETVVLPATVTSLGSNAFMGCTNLRSIDISSVSTLGEHCFDGCSSLRDIILNGSLVRIPAYCFSGCESLGTLTIPASVREIRPYVFSGTDGLRVDVLSDRATVYSKAFVTGDMGTITVNTVLNTSAWDISDTDARYNDSEFTLTMVMYGDVRETVTYHATDIIAWENPAPRSGYVFTGWDRMPARMPVGDLTVNAIWNANGYIVHFDPSGGTGSMVDQGLIVDVSTLLSACTFRNGDKAFLGWSETSDGDVDHPENVRVVNLADSGSLTLYAVWGDADYTVEFDPNGGTGVMDAQYLADGSGRFLYRNAFSREGYLFQGWSLSLDGSIAYNDGGFYIDSSAGDVILYAVWKKITYQIVFNVNGGDGSMDSASVRYDEEYILPECTFTRTGYHFVKWSTSPGGTDRYDPGTMVRNLSTTSGGTAVFYAIWDNNTYAIEFDPNGGTGEMNFIGAIYNNYKALPKCTFSREGFVFAGWAETPDGDVRYTDQQMVLNLTSVNNGSVRLYAVWAEGAPVPPVSDGFNVTVAVAVVVAAVIGVLAFFLDRRR